MNQFMRQQGLNSADTAGMLTAAIVKDVGVSSLSMETRDYEEALTETLQVTSWVTVGLGNKARAGAWKPVSSLYPGTINSIVVINGCLTDSAMVNCVITATEAKAAALQDLGVQADGLTATGTTTDAVLIAATGRGRTYNYAGTVTQLGYLIGRTVYEATLASGRLNLKSFTGSKALHTD